MTREIKFRAWDGDTSRGYKQHGYQLRKAEWHPNCNGRGYVMEHRLVMERHMGEYLPKHAIIHHKNLVRDDNRLENLEYMPEQERHAKHHDNGKRNPNGQFVASSPEFHSKKFRLLNKNTGLMQEFTLAKLIATTFRKSQFEYRGEFTGLKDKNGTEIYEGDIIHLKHETGLNEWEESNEVVEFNMGGFTAGIYSDPNDNADCEVIGNIYENPELLSDKE